MGKRQINTRIKPKSQSTFVFSETATQDEYDLYESHMSDVETRISNLKGDEINSKNVHWVEVERPITSDNKLLLNNFGGQTITLDIEKEASFKDYISDLNVGDILQIYVDSDKNGVRGSLKSLQTEITNQELHKSVNTTDTAFLGKVISKNNGGFILDINGVHTFLPGSRATANKVENFDLKEWIGKEINVMVEKYSSEHKIFIVSNKKYLKTILPQKIQELDLTKKYNGRVTGTKDFGIFIEFDEIFTALLHKMEMSDDILAKFNSGYYKPNTLIDNLTIKEVQRNNRIILTTKDYSKIKRELNKWFLDNKGNTYKAKVKGYNKNTNDYNIKLVSDNMPDYALHGILKHSKRLNKDSIIDVKLSGLQSLKIKPIFKMVY